MDILEFLQDEVFAEIKEITFIHIYPLVSFEIYLDFYFLLVL